VRLRSDKTSFTKWIQADVALSPFLWDEEEEKDIYIFKKRKEYGEYHTKTGRKWYSNKALFLLDPIGCLGRV